MRASNTIREFTLQHNTGWVDTRDLCLSVTNLSSYGFMKKAEDSQLSELHHITELKNKTYEM